MDWQAISEAALWDLINLAESRMSPRQRRVWDAVRILPVKWAEPSYGKEGGGFWVVAVFGETVVWYNDIEDGFNHSSYTQFGVIDEYWCNQDELEHVMEYILGRIDTGHNEGPRAGPPQAGTYPGQ